MNYTPPLPYYWVWLYIHHYQWISHYLIMLWSAELKSLSHVRLFVTPWTVAYPAPLSMGFSRQEYWSGLPFPSPGHREALFFLLCFNNVKWHPFTSTQITPFSIPSKVRLVVDFPYTSICLFGKVFISTSFLKIYLF